MSLPPEIGVRPAAVGDLDVLEEMYAAAAEAVRPQRGGELDLLLRGRIEPIRASFDIELVRAESLVVVGTIDEEPVGYGVIGVEHLPDDTSLARVSDLFVLAPARGVGVGEAILGAMIEFGTERGCRGIDARALPGDRVTKNFFESFGLVARSIEVYKSFA